MTLKNFRAVTQLKKKFLAGVIAVNFLLAGCNEEVAAPKPPLVKVQKVALSNAALATSGNYRRYYEHNGKRIAHTIDPRTGYPAQTEVLSATVIAPTCMLADAYATAFMVTGEKKAVEICEQEPHISCLLIISDGKDKEYKIVTSKNFEK